MDTALAQRLRYKPAVSARGKAADHQWNFAISSAWHRLLRGMDQLRLKIL